MVPPNAQLARRALLLAALAGLGGCLDFAVAPGALRCDPARERPCPFDWRCVPEAGAALGRCHPALAPSAEPLLVAPAYPQAALWLDHVRRSDPTLPHHAQPGEPCDAQRDEAIGACIHAGELRIARTALASCAGLDVRDELEALQWRCEEQQGRALLVATGLREGAGLGDLLADATRFKANRVLVRQGAGGPLLAQSAPAVWWNNPVRPLPLAGGEPLRLAEPGAIYVAAGDASCPSYELAAERVAVVALPGAALTLRDGSDTCAVATRDGLRHRCLFAVGERSFVWLEGELRGGGAAFGVHADRARYLRLRRLRTSDFWHSGIAARELVSARLEDVVASRNGNAGIGLGGRHAVLARISAFGNGVRQTNPGHSGVLLTGLRDSVLTSLTLGSNAHYGLLASEGSRGNTIGFVTTALNGYTGIGISADGESTLLQLVSLRQGKAGVVIRAPHNQLAQAAIGHQEAGVLILDAGDATLSHELVLAANDKDCGVPAAVPCAQHGTPRLVPQVSLAGALAGKLARDDARNRDDEAGAAPGAAIGDWLRFESRHRGWGADGADALADASNVGLCGERCRIWDLDLGPQAELLRPRDAAGQPDAQRPAAGAACPAALDGDLALTDRSGNSFLLHARELFGDGLGDDDGLCESAEACVHQPHAGDAQRGAALAGARCLFRDGLVRGVLLYGRGD